MLIVKIVISFILIFNTELPLQLEEYADFQDDFKRNEMRKYEEYMKEG